MGIFRPDKDVNIDKVKGDETLRLHTKQRTQTAVWSTWSQKSRDPHKVGTEGTTRQTVPNKTTCRAEMKPVAWTFVLFPDQFVRDCKLTAGR